MAFACHSRAFPFAIAELCIGHCWLGLAAWQVASEASVEEG